MVCRPMTLGPFNCVSIGSVVRIFYDKLNKILYKVRILFIYIVDQKFLPVVYLV